MPALLLSLDIRGVRSYSPEQNKAQSIEFLPLTLIVGPNGNGKTTIIESLRFVISGEEPPLSDARRNFIHTSKDGGRNLDKKIPHASIKLHFQSSRGQDCVAKRDMFLPQAKTVTPAVSSYYRVGESAWNNIHKQDDWAKTIPSLFSLPNQAILNHVILCHQEENLWCMGQSAEVKQIFDRIFGCELYKKEIKNLDAEIKTCKSELVVCEKDFSHEREKIDRKILLRGRLDDFKNEVTNLVASSRALIDKISTAEDRRSSIKEKVTKLENQKLESSMYKQRMEELALKEKQLRLELEATFIDPEVVTDNELEQKVKSHYTLLDDTRARQSKLKQNECRIFKEIKELEARKESVQSEMNRSKVLALKMEDTRESMTNMMQKIKLEHTADAINPTNIETSLRALAELEAELSQKKSDCSSLEDQLSNDQQRLTKSISHLKGLCQSYLERIKSKENFLDTLQHQLDHADPVVKDLLSVSNNLEKMLNITGELPPSKQITLLTDLIENSSKVLASAIGSITEDSVLKIKHNIENEQKSLEDDKTFLDKHREHMETLSKQLVDNEAEHAKAKTEAKAAHNVVLRFKSAYMQVENCYNRYSREKQLVDSKNLDKGKEQLKEIGLKIEELREEANSLSTEHSRLTDEISNSMKLHTEYQTNLQIRDVITRSRLISEKLSTMNEGVEFDDELAELNSEYNEANTTFLELRDERARISGSKAQIMYQIESLERELDQLQGISKKFAETLGKIACNKIVLDDLGKLKECFQESIITFHNHMILKINEVLRIRWRQIYRGSDIDRIELVAEEIVRGKEKKSFNYHLAMQKGGISMRMRVKSSAGQKALASIILRMTLAELFVKDFAFIALDEPTANLDQNNAQSLAKAIGSYVKRRNGLGINIQWIIITHNEQFLAALNSECSPYFYRIQLDEEGCSKIVKTSFQALTVADN